MLMLGHVRMQVDADISIDAKQTAACHRIDQGSMSRQSKVGLECNSDRAFHLVRTFEG